MAFLPTLFRTEPYEVFPSMQKEINRLFDTFWGTPARLPVTGNGGEPWFPAMDLRETKDAYLMRIEIPGILPEDIQIDVVDQELIIRGEMKQEEEKTGQTWHRRELRKGKFYRSLTLPALDPEKIKATYKNGVLELNVAKREGQKGRAVKVEVQK
jgi:HSP20 family protein